MDNSVRSPTFLAIVVVLVLVELAWRRISRRGYDRRTALTSLGIVAGYVPAALVSIALIAAIYQAASTLTPLHLPADRPWVWVLGFFGFEFAYYWFHRMSHRVRWLWATHSVHHTSEQMTLLSSFRLGWTHLFSGGWLFYVPLVLIGFDAAVVLALFGFNLQYQFFLHTEARVPLGPLEYVFNSPSHHRVHHAVDDGLVDRNFGGVLILYDRLFGTFAPEPVDAKMTYGLRGRERDANPLRLVLREWRLLLADLRRARPGQWLRTALGAP
jgi:sterol desaturase/sphingolipid hydroxylase (fatty acid hydroxylase superfamily)